MCGRRMQRRTNVRNERTNVLSFICNDGTEGKGAIVCRHNQCHKVNEVAGYVNVSQRTFQQKVVQHVGQERRRQNCGRKKPKLKGIQTSFTAFESKQFPNRNCSSPLMKVHPSLWMLESITTGSPCNANLESGSSQKTIVLTSTLLQWAKYYLICIYEHITFFLYPNDALRKMHRRLTDAFHPPCLEGQVQD